MPQKWTKLISRKIFFFFQFYSPMTKVRGQTEAKAQENQQITSESLTRTRSQTQRSITLCSHRTEVAPPEKVKKG